MRQFKLLPRLQAIADLVPLNSRVADVGTDHGHLAIYLSDLGHRVIATDLSPEPLQRAYLNIKASGADNIDLRLGDGLSVISPDEVDVIVIAGLGGQTICEMLTPWSSGDLLLLLQPMSQAQRLREALADEGFCIENEIIVDEPGRLYPIISARRGYVIKPPGHPYVSAPLLENSSLNAVRYRELIIRRLRRALEGLTQSKREEDAVREVEMRRVLYELEEYVRNRQNKV